MVKFNKGKKKKSWYFKSYLVDGELMYIGSVVTQGSDNRCFTSRVSLNIVIYFSDE